MPTGDSECVLGHDCELFVAYVNRAVAFNDMGDHSVR